MIYFLITTSLASSSPIRRRQYRTGITKLQRVLSSGSFPEYKIIIIENNGKRPTMFDHFGCEVFYTNNNILPTNNRGYKELKDIRDCINVYRIQNDDFIVKLTGRYVLEDTSDFMSEIKRLPITNHHCILRYGSYDNPVDHKTNDCITGLIGMRTVYLKQIPFPDEYVAVEWKWAEISLTIPDENVCKLKRLGINICPGGNRYFLV